LLAHIRLAQVCLLSWLNLCKKTKTKILKETFSLLHFGFCCFITAYSFFFVFAAVLLHTLKKEISMATTLFFIIFLYKL